MPDEDAGTVPQDRDEVTRRALAEPARLKELVAVLAEDDKRARAAAAAILHEVACADAAKLLKYSSQLVDALSRPEAPTRWEVLGALEVIAATEPEKVEPAVGPATDALHDSESSVVREAAFRMLAAYGATSAKRAQAMWPLLDEALRAYHGDPEYPGMLSGLVVMVEGAAPIGVRREAAALVDHDTTHPKQLISRRAKRISKAAKAKGRSRKAK